MSHPPEPLLVIDSPSAATIARLVALDARQREYATLRAAGGLLENTRESLRIENTYHSIAIEGNTLSFRDTQLVLEGRTPAASHSLREVYEARNHDRALRLAEQWVAHRDTSHSISESDIISLHREVLADIDVHAGSFRTERVLIAGSGFVPPGSHKFPTLIPALLALANRPGVHAVVSAAEIHYNFAAIHPFRDGNGRTARLLMNWRLLRSGYPITTIDVAQRPAYLAALDSANAGQSEPFLELIVAAVERAFIRVLGEPAA